MSIDKVQKSSALIMLSLLGVRDQARGTPRDSGHEGQAAKKVSKNRKRAKLAKASRKRNR